MYPLNIKIWYGWELNFNVWQRKGGLLFSYEGFSLCHIIGFVWRRKAKQRDLIVLVEIHFQSSNSKTIWPCFFSHVNVFNRSYVSPWQSGLCCWRRGTSWTTILHFLRSIEQWKACIYLMVWKKSFFCENNFYHFFHL